MARSDSTPASILTPSTSTDVWSPLEPPALISTVPSASDVSASLIDPPLEADRTMALFAKSVSAADDVAALVAGCGPTFTAVMRVSVSVVSSALKSSTPPTTGRCVAGASTRVLLMLVVSAAESVSATDPALTGAVARSEAEDGTVTSVVLLTATATVTALSVTCVGA